MCTQRSENLIYKDQRYGMRNDPLAKYFRDADIKPNFFMPHTGLHRGYTGTWEIADDLLYLISLSGEVYRKPDDVAPANNYVWGNFKFSTTPINVGTFFPDNPNRVFASWYSGTLVLLDGEFLGRRGWDIIYERDVLIKIQAGVVIDTEIRVNKAPEPETFNFSEGSEDMF
jgi:hypothetical protein